jgi:hypothetical protein
LVFEDGINGVGTNYSSFVPSPRDAKDQRLQGVIEFPANLG